jgi:hypothetical protein
MSIATARKRGRPRDKVAHRRAEYLRARWEASGLPLTVVVRELCRATGRKERPTYEMTRRVMTGAGMSAPLLGPLDDALEALGA